VASAVGDEAARADATGSRAIFALLGHDWDRARELSAAAVDLAGVDPTVAASAHHFAGLLALGVGELDAAAQHFVAASDALATVPGSARPFFSVVCPSTVTDVRGEVPIPMGEDSMLLGRRVGTAQARAYVAAAGATVERLAGRLDTALALLDEATDRFGALGDVYGTAYATNQRAHALRWSGDLEAAVECFARAEELRASLRDLRAVAMSAAGRVVVDAMLGRADAARRRAAEVIGEMRRTGDVPGTALMLNNTALVEAVLGADDVAASLMADSLATGAETLAVYGIGWQCLFHAQLLTNLGDDDSALGAVTAAAARFEQLGDEAGSEAVLRPRKEVRITIPGG
jgi:tetratricopeptide (TPR) repeat protein